MTDAILPNFSFFAPEDGIFDFFEGDNASPTSDTLYCAPNSFLGSEIVPSNSPLEQTPLEQTAEQVEQQQPEDSINPQDLWPTNTPPTEPIQPRTNMPVFVELNSLEKVAADAIFPTAVPAPQQAVPQTANLTLDDEKAIAKNVLLSVFPDSSSEADKFHELLFPTTVTQPRLLLAPVPLPVQATQPTTTTTQQPQQMPGTEGPSHNVKTVAHPDPQYQLILTNFTASHFAKDKFPPFRITVQNPDGTPIQRQDLPEDVSVSINIRNKWADVTREVCGNFRVVRKLVHGETIVDDLCFNEVSMKHGGCFFVEVHAIVLPNASADLDEQDCETAILEEDARALSYRSEAVTIQSVKTHCNLKRKRKQEREERNKNAKTSKRT